MFGIFLLVLLASELAEGGVTVCFQYRGYDKDTERLRSVRHSRGYIKYSNKMKIAASQCKTLACMSHIYNCLILCWSSINVWQNLY